MAGPQVLLVDDDSEICEFLAILLELEGFPPHCTTRGEEALAFAEREQPAAVLLDVAMPDVDGFEVCRRLRASGVRSAILVVSARPGGGLGERARPARAGRIPPKGRPTTRSSSAGSATGSARRERLSRPRPE